MDRRASVAGAVLIVLGAILLAARLDLITFSPGVILWGIVAVGGGVMLVRGFRHPAPANGRIFWGAMFLAIGLLQLADEWWPMGMDPGIEGPLYVAAPAVALILVVIRNPRDWHMLVPAVALIVLASGMYMTEIGTLTRSEVMDTMGSYWPVALVAFGVAMILTGWRKSQPS